MKIRLLIISLLLSLTAWSQEQEDSLSQEKKWSPEDILNTESMGSVTFSPDHQMVVWSKRKMLKKEDKYVNDLYLTRLNVQEDGVYKTVPLTNAKESDHSAIFSRDGQTIYFLSSRKGGNTLWSLSIYGGEPVAVDSFPNGISNLEWLNDSTLTYVSNEGETLYDQQAEENHDETVIVEDSVHWKIDRVYAYDLNENTSERLTDNEFPVSGYAVSKDGRWLLTALQLSPHYGADGHPKPEYYLYDLENDNKTQILDTLQTPGSFEFTPDSKGFYFSAVLSSDPEWDGAGISELYYYTLGNHQYVKVPLDWEDGIGNGYELYGNSLVAYLSNGATYLTAFYQKDGDSWKKTMLDFGDKDEHITGMTFSEDGKKIVYEYSTASKLPRYFIGDAALKKGSLSIANDKQIIKLNKELGKKGIARSEVITWKGYQGDEVNGILYYPANYEEGKKYPLVLSIHGGPSGWDTDSWDDSWAYFPQIYSQKGAFILRPNYHGSGNHGLAFVESIKKNYYDPELEDITKGIEMLAEQGKIDTSQMASTGWSNGAILTTMLTVRYPNMFKAAAPGAGDVNWTSDYGTCRFGVTFDQSYFGGAPWDDVDGKPYNEAYIAKSPLFEMDKVKTPTIIFHGSEDRAVPRDQGWEYYRALQQNKQAPVRFLWFPGQLHGINKPSYQLRKMKEEIAWLDKYLFETYKPKNESFKEDSPLAQLLEKQKAGAEEGVYGEKENDLLIPEVVEIKKDSTSIGRFEVTNAQFAAYKSDFQFNPKDGNKPVYGIDFDEAKAYVQWLSEKTGDHYRLPNEKEVKSLQKKAHDAGAEGNTLNYWAGYDITWGEVSSFRQKLDSVKTELVKEVGTFKPVKVGEAKVYDLGGNVAEYAADGSVYDYSAYDFVDTHQSKGAKEKDKKYVGLRVIKDSRK